MVKHGLLLMSDFHSDSDSKPAGSIQYLGQFHFKTSACGDNMAIYGHDWGPNLCATRSPKNSDLWRPSAWRGPRSWRTISEAPRSHVEMADFFTQTNCQFWVYLWTRFCWIFGCSSWIFGMILTYFEKHHVPSFESFVSCHNMPQCLAGGLGAFKSR